MGFPGLQYEADWLMLSKLYIPEHGCGQGLGKQAEALTVAEAHANSYPEIRLFANEHHADSIAIYQRLGYVLQPLETHSFGNGHSVRDWRMIKTL